MFIFNILGWCIFGLIVGAISRLLLPGNDPMSWLSTMLLGVAGSFGFGVLFYMLFGGGDDRGIEPSGYIGSIIGAVVLLVVMRYLRKKNVNTDSGR